jgi:hypothetical protein
MNYEVKLISKKGQQVTIYRKEGVQLKNPLQPRDYHWYKGKWWYVTSVAFLRHLPEG